MSRPARYIIPAIFLSLGLVFTGCKTIYSDTYSPRRNHFVRLQEKPKPEPASVVVDAGASSATDLQGMGLPPAAPTSAPAAPAMPDAGAAPMIPGL